MNWLGTWPGRRLAPVAAAALIALPTFGGAPPALAAVGEMAQTAQRYGSIAPPPARGWTSADGVSGLERLLPDVRLSGEERLGSWRVLNGQYGGTYVYLFASSVPLGAHTDVADAGDLAAEKLDLYCRRSDGCEVVAKQTHAVGGLDVEIADVRLRHDFDEPISLDPVAVETDGETVADEVRWHTRLAHAVIDGTGYEVRLASIDESLFYGRFGDFERALTGLTGSVTSGAGTAAGPAPTATPPASATPAASVAAGLRLAGTPRLGTDVTLVLQGGRGWVDARRVDGLDAVMRLDALAGEQLLGRWRRLHGASFGPYVYAQLSAIPLEQWPEVRSANDLGALKLDQYCRHSDGCQITGPQAGTAGTAGTAGAEAAAVYATTERREFRDGARSLEGLAVESDDEHDVDEVTWHAEHAFLVRGNWGFELRLSSTDPGALAARGVDLDALLAGLSFGY